MRIAALLIFLWLATGLASAANLVGNYSGYCSPFNDGPSPQDGYEIHLSVHRHAHGRFWATGVFVHQIGNPRYASETFPFSARIYHMRVDRIGGVSDGEITSSSGSFHIALPDGLTGKVDIIKPRPNFRRDMTESSLFFLYKGSKSYGGDLLWDEGSR